MKNKPNIMNRNSDTLVIHPADVTTDCLSVIYAGRKWDIIRDFFTPDEEVREAIRNHDRIIMLGHGTPAGLLCSDGTHRFAGYIIDHSHASLFEGKETLSIWCNSDQYFKQHGLKGLHTGMIISEVSEEWYVLGTCPLGVRQMAENMELFCGAFAKHIDESPEECAKKVLEEYVGDDLVTTYNRKRITVL